MQHVAWAITALLAYSVLPPLVKVAVEDVPSEAALFIVNGTLMVLLPVFILTTGGEILPYLTDEKVPYLVAAGVALTVALIAFYRGLATGPVSVVVPIFGLFLVGSSAMGVALFGEALTARKGLAIATAVASVYLVSAG